MHLGRRSTQMDADGSSEARVASVNGFGRDENAGHRLLFLQPEKRDNRGVAESAENAGEQVGYHPTGACQAAPLVVCPALRLDG